MLGSIQSSVQPGLETALERVDDYFRGKFEAMASPCEVLIDTDDREEAETLLETARREAIRVECKFSRYRKDNILYRINNSGGQPVEVDPETAHLLDYAATCHEISDGMFDITSGVLRRVWKFDGSDRVPSHRAVRDVLRHIGWHHVKWENQTLSLPAGMEIDLGGFGKEYAVDRTAVLIASQTQNAFLVNFGGDLFASGLRRWNRTWAVGIDDPQQPGNAALYRLDISRAALATSGDARRYVIWKGKRLGHILNPKTGWPVKNAPRSVTVLGPTCIEAGTLSTLAYLQGNHAREFLQQQRIPFWLL